MEKEKITLSGVNETLFVPLYARALESRKPNHLFYDETAVRVIDSLDYDFEKQGKSSMNMWGCAARTVIFDEQTKAHIAAYPDCCVINMACGLDDRFSRVDNGRIHWYNIDFPDVIELREKLIAPNDRVTDLPCSVFDYSWIDRIENKDHALILAEGFLMYITAEEAKELFTTVAERFTHSCLLLELMTQWMVDHQQLHDTTHANDVTFKWGVKETAEFTTLCPQYELTGEYNFTDGMKHFAPVRMAFIAPILRKRNNRLGCFVQR